MNPRITHRATGALAAIVSIVPAMVFMTAPASADDIPSHPRELEFAPLEFTPPAAENFRHVLSNGVVVFCAPSREFPLIDLSMTFRGGSYMDPPGKTGLAGMTGRMMRQGGTTSIPAEEVDEQLDFLASQVRIFVGDTSAGAGMNCLTSNFDETFDLMLELIRTPGYQQDRVELERSEIIERMKQRNDNASGVVRREWNWLLYGNDHFSAREATLNDVESITADDMRAMQHRIFHPGNLYIAVSGDFETAEMLKTLESAMSGWEAGEVAPPIPDPTAELVPGVYHAEQDIPQGKVRIGMRTIERDDPDYFPMLVMNDILGGGGFTSRITNRVRSDEGLAYSAGSRFGVNPYYPGAWSAAFDSKNRTVALAIKLIYEEIERVRDEPVTAEELETAKASFIETFPRTFESRPTMLNVFVTDEMTDRPAGYWQSFRDNIRAVTAEDVQRVAKTHLSPENMAILVVGKWEEIYGGDLEGRATMADFFGGSVAHRPKLDPLTLEASR
jgi:predicted Zn-dependent peptidase